MTYTPGSALAITGDASFTANFPFAPSYQECLFQLTIPDLASYLRAASTGGLTADAFTLQTQNCGTPMGETLLDAIAQQPSLQFLENAPLVALQIEQGVGGYGVHWPGAVRLG